VNVPASTYYGAANAHDVDYSEAEVYSGAVNYTHRFSDTLSLRNGLRYYDYLLDRNNTLPTGPVNETALTVQLNRSQVARDEHGWFNQTELTQTLTLAGQPHELLYGIEVGRQDKDQLARSLNNVAVVSLFDPVLPTLPLAIASAPTTDNTGTMKRALLMCRTWPRSERSGKRWSVFATIASIKRRSNISPGNGISHV
jgi:catecholate siderophore receptor